MNNKKTWLQPDSNPKNCSKLHVCCLRDDCCLLIVVGPSQNWTVAKLTLHYIVAYIAYDSLAEANQPKKPQKTAQGQ